MKILIISPVFYPSVGGLENLVLMLAQGFCDNGEQVCLITNTPAKQPDNFSFTVIRNAGWKEKFEYYRWCDIYFQPNMSLNNAWMPLLQGKKQKWVVSHNGCEYYDWKTGKETVISKLKVFLSQFAHNICVSDAVGKNLKLKKYTVIYNSYDDKVFYNKNTAKRKNIIFVGRLNDSKGCDLLISAFAELITQIPDVCLSIVGDGDERKILEKMVKDLKLTKNIVFCGIKQHNELACLLNEHFLMVVPSIYKEAFGIVALEGLACGCSVLVSDGDGLQEAVGESGYTFKKGDKASLTQMLFEIYSDLQQHDTGIVREHLRNHTKEAVVQQYMSFFEKAYKKINKKNAVLSNI